MLRRLKRRHQNQRTTATATNTEVQRKKDMSPVPGSPKPTRKTGGASENQKESSPTRNMTTSQNSRPERTSQPPYKTIFVLEDSYH